jgi:hypothetical protein
MENLPVDVEQLAANGLAAMLSGCGSGRPFGSIGVRRKMSRQMRAAVMPRPQAAEWADSRILNTFAVPFAPSCSANQNFSIIVLS